MRVEWPKNKEPAGQETECTSEHPITFFTDEVLLNVRTLDTPDTLDIAAPTIKIRDPNRPIY